MTVYLLNLYIVTSALLAHWSCNIICTDVFYSILLCSSWTFFIISLFALLFYVLCIFVFHCWRIHGLQMFVATLRLMMNLWIFESLSLWVFESLNVWMFLSFTAECEREKRVWMEALQDAIAETLSDYEVAEKIWSNRSNRTCADCRALNPDWASINLSVVICKNCAGTCSRPIRSTHRPPVIYREITEELKYSSILEMLRKKLWILGFWEKSLNFKILRKVIILSKRWLFGHF